MDVEVVDRGHLREISGGDADFEGELASEFLTSTSKLLSELGELIGNSDHDEIRRIAHTLKGSSQTFGARHLAQLALDLEVLAREGKTENYRDAWAAISAEADRVFEYIAAHWGDMAA